MGDVIYPRGTTVQSILLSIQNPTLISQHTAPRKHTPSCLVRAVHRPQITVSEGQGCFLNACHLYFDQGSYSGFLKRII